MYKKVIKYNGRVAKVSGIPPDNILSTRRDDAIIGGSSQSSTFLFYIGSGQFSTQSSTVGIKVPIIKNSGSANLGTVSIYPGYPYGDTIVDSAQNRNLVDEDPGFFNPPPNSAGPSIYCFTPCSVQFDASKWVVSNDTSFIYLTTTYSAQITWAAGELAQSTNGIWFGFRAFSDSATNSVSFTVQSISNIFYTSFPSEIPASPTASTINFLRAPDTGGVGISPYGKDYNKYMRISVLDYNS